MININDVLEGKISCNASGSAYLVSNDLPKDIYLSKNNTNKALHLDTVKIKVIPGNGRSLEGEVIEIVERFRTEFVGVIQISPRYAFFIPDSNKLPIDFFIPISKICGAKDGQKVIARLVEWKDDAKNPNGEIVRVIGDAGEHETEIHSIMSEYNLPYEFPEEVLLEAEAISSDITQIEIDKRIDLRNITTISIDPYDSKDADDTLGLEWINGECFISVNIADISFYARPDTELDKEAYKRGTSVYLVDRVVGMFPERLSNNICSLKSGSDKLAFSVIFKIDSNGNILDKQFGRTIINVNKDYSYEEAQSVIDNGVREENKQTDLVVLELNRIAKKLRKDRAKNEFLSLEKQEIKFKLDKDNKPIEIVFKSSGDSNKLIEEFMLLANKEVAIFIKSKGYPCVNRAHKKPDTDKLETLKHFVKQFGYELDLSDSEKIKQSLNKLLIDSKDSVESNMISTLITRTQQKAFYTTKNLGHYGLGFKDYSHFTSPIRRYSDIMTHRLLGQALGNNGYPIK